MVGGSSILLTEEKYFSSGDLDSIDNWCLVYQESFSRWWFRLSGLPPLGSNAVSPWTWEKRKGAGMLACSPLPITSKLPHQRSMCWSIQSHILGYHNTAHCLISDNNCVESSDAVLWPLFTVTVSSALFLTSMPYGMCIIAEIYPPPQLFDPWSMWSSFEK